ncbi:MAG: hypothetical protein FWD11_04265 [Micrococcales bacterium]|nr:hypothetical protein [Micrococcales bacterium]
MVNKLALRMPQLRQGHRSVLILAVVAAVSLVVGMGLSQLIQSPGQAAANRKPPEAGPITYKVDKRVISNDIPLRAEIKRENAVELVRAAGIGDTGTPAVVTGQIPENGSELTAGQVVLEVTGRPVIALVGELPVYRDLGPGMSGPDVVQLREALRDLGINAGDVRNNVYDASLATAVRALYSRAGYTPPALNEALDESVKAANSQVTAASQQVSAAQRTLDAARRGGATNAEIVAADGAVTVARSQLSYWDAECPKPLEDRSPDAMGLDCTPPGRVTLTTALNSAVASRGDLDTPPDTASAAADVATANQALADARTDLSTAQGKALTPLPAGEVVYVPAMPCRINNVSLKRGQTLADGPFATVSGTKLEARGQVAADDAAQLRVGATGTITVEDAEYEVTIAQIADVVKEGGGTDTRRQQVVFAFAALTPEQERDLAGRSVRVMVPVGSTDGEVLAVPLAALSAGPDGSSRVQVLDGSTVRLVQVTTGLAANGYVEIKSAKPTLSEGDLVVLDAATAARASTKDDE